VDRTGVDRVGEIIAAAVRERAVPGVVALAGRGPLTLGSWVAGDADTTVGAGSGTPRPMRADTVFDLASLTKVVATTTTTLALAGAGRIGLDDPVRRYLPVSWDVSIRQLLSHTSGLPASVLFFEWCSSRAEVLRDLFATPLEAPPGTRVAYSDLGFMALGEVVAQVAGAPLDAAFLDLVAVPLGMADTSYLPLGAGSAASSEPSPSSVLVPAGGFAATELRADGTPWTGIVHDENARAMGGVAGHAGVFGTAADLGRFAAWWVSDAEDGPVPVALRREAQRCQTCRPGGDLGGRRGLGWVLPGDRFDILGDAWPASAVSHTGFTGTSLALHSASGLWAVVLTNNVHFGRGRLAIRALRREIHGAIAQSFVPRA
jgi:CubicO group peptidase (beta-lactamase class C family)